MQIILIQSDRVHLLYSLANASLFASCFWLRNNFIAETRLLKSNLLIHVDNVLADLHLHLLNDACKRWAMTLDENASKVPFVTN